jgi:hypothetical protein
VKQLFLGVFNVWRNLDYLQPEEYFGTYQDLFTRWEMQLEYWPVAADVYVKKGGSDKITTYHRVIAGTLLPYLTEQGKESYMEGMKAYA